MREHEVVASLEKAMAKWIKRNCEDIDHDGFWSPTLARSMALAANAVMTEAFSSQTFQSEQTS